MAKAKNPPVVAVGTPRADGEYREIEVARMHLNPQNPRHKPLDDEPAIIEALFDTEAAGALARDIAERGALSPLEIIGVTEMPDNPGHYVTLEGNRRTCALILLSDPFRSPTPEIRQQMLDFSKLSTVPAKVMVFVFPSNSVALPWIDLRHMGLQGGVGTKEWTPDQQVNSLSRREGVKPPAKAAAKPNILAQTVLTRLLDIGAITPEQREEISLTTIARYLSTPGVRALLGLGHHQELIHTHDHAEVDAALTRLALDSLPTVPGQPALVNSRADKGQRVAYAQGLAGRGLAPITPLASPAAPPTPVPGNQTKARRSKANPNLQRRLITAPFTVDVADQALLRLRHEMLLQDIEHHEFASNYLLRAFVERVLVLYLRARGRISGSQHLNDRDLLIRSADELKKADADRRIHMVVNNAASEEATPYGLKCLGAAVHGSVFPTKADLLKHMATWTPALQFMLASIRDHDEAKKAGQKQRR